MEVVSHRSMVAYRVRLERFKLNKPRIADLLETKLSGRKPGCAQLQTGEALFFHNKDRGAPFIAVALIQVMVKSGTIRLK